MRLLTRIRRHALGLPCLLLAVLILVARLASPGMAMPAAATPGPSDDPIARLAMQTICHAGTQDAQPGPVEAPAHKDCLLCPACHLVSQAALVVPVLLAVPAPPVVLGRIAVALPPATAPPGRPRVAAHPTGPPRFIV